MSTAKIVDNSWINSSAVGKTGEDTACLFLVKHGHTILDRNFRKTYGEIDIVSEKNRVIHFVEVKSVSRLEEGNYMPEDNVHYKKRLRLARTIRAYLSEKKIPRDKEFVVDVIAIFLDFKARKARIRFTENIVLLG